MISCLLNLANILPMKVFRGFSDNLNNVVTNSLLFWISFVFAIMQSQNERGVTREFQAKCFIYVYLALIGGLSMFSILVKGYTFIQNIKRTI